MKSVRNDRFMLSMVLAAGCAMCGFPMAALALDAALPPASSSVSQGGAGVERVALVIPDLRTFTEVNLALPQGNPDRFEIGLTIAGKHRLVSAARRSLRAAAFTLFVPDEHGALEPQPAPPVRTYRGLVDGEPERGVALQLVDGALCGLIDLGDAGVFMVQPASDFAAGQPVGRHVIYDTRDVIPRDVRCGNDLVKLGVPDWIVDGPKDQGSGGVAGEQPQIVEIAFDADFDFFIKNGASVTNTVNDIELIMNGVDFIYDRDVNIGFEFTTIVVRSTIDDPYSAADAEGKLCEIRNLWNAAPESGIQRDVAQLYTGKNLDGGTIGLAWLGVICNQGGSDCGGPGNLAYSIVESRFTTILSYRQALSAHELGHNWNAQHCDGNGDCHIMCSSTGSCNGINGANLKFGAGEVAQIVAFKSSVSCDSIEPLPLSQPLVDTFPNASIDALKWNYNNGAATSTAATNEPSATRSLNLDASGGGIYDYDEIRTNEVLLGGQLIGLCSYWTERKGVESGKRLYVEYLSSGGNWIVLNTIESDGVDQADFVQSMHQLPTNALHNGFRLRFRNDAVQTNDDWYIDDVLVAAPRNKDRLNSDARSDIALHNTTLNTASVWFMNGLTSTSGGATSVTPTAGWTAQGMGDFDGDGRADILWREPSGQMRIWLMSGQTVLTNSPILGASAIAATYSVVGIADVGGDGKADILFRNSATSNIHAWIMDGVTRTAGGIIASAAGLETIGTGDLDGDGKSDLVFRNASGLVSAWLLNGFAIVTQGNLTNAPAIGSAFVISAIGDLDGDGRADLVWRNTSTGQVNAWLLEALNRKVGGVLGFIPLVWTLEATADLNGDTKGDLVWTNSSTGQINGWLMNGLTKVSGGAISGISATGVVVNQ